MSGCLEAAAPEADGEAAGAAKSRSMKADGQDTSTQADGRRRSISPTTSSASKPRADILRAASTGSSPSAAPGTHKTKIRSEVAGTGKKPYKQKGTGGARQGSRAGRPLRGGGIVFGPAAAQPRDRPAEEGPRARAAPRAVGEACKAGTLVVLDNANLRRSQDQGPAWPAASASSAGATPLVIAGAGGRREFRAAPRATSPTSTCCRRIGANVYDILRRDTLVLTRPPSTASERAA